MRAAGPHKVVVGQAIQSIAGIEIPASKTTGAGINAVPLRVVEDVERFGPELDGLLLFDFKMLEQAHVEVGARRILHNIALRCPEGQPFRRRECRRIEKQRTVDALDTGRNTGRRVGIADNIQIRTCSRTVAYSGIEKSITQAKRSARLKGSKTGEFPSSEQRVHQTFLSEKWQIINVAEIQDLALIEIRTGPGLVKIVRVDKV